MNRTLPIFFLVMAVWRCPTAGAATVTSTADGGPGSLREAIANAAAGETIDFTVNGSITLTSGELAIARNLTVLGPGPGNLTIQRSPAAGTPDFRIFHVQAGSVRISGLTLSNGRAPLGAGIHNERDLIVEDCVLSGNTATIAGGAIHNSSGTLTLNGSTLSSNAVAAAGGDDASGGGLNNTGTATLNECLLTGNAAMGGPADGDGAGGAIHNTGTIIIRHSTLRGNAAAGAAAGNGSGGAIRNGGTVTLTNSLVSENMATGGAAGGDSSGGAIYSDGTAELWSSTIRDNAAVGGAAAAGPGGGSRGGGIVNDLGTVMVIQSTISGNTATGGTSADNVGGAGQGGGLASECGTVIVDNSTLSGNRAVPGRGSAAGATAGGGIFNDCGSASLTHSTVTDNAGGAGSTPRGSGLFNTTGGVELKNTILAGNGAGADLFNEETGAVFSGGFNLVGSTNAPVTAGPQDRFNVTAAELRLGALDDNGGPTFTHALLCGSPAINGGDNADAPLTDQRGFPRIVGGRIDVGALEDDNHAPTIACPPAGAVPATGPAGAQATVTVEAADADAGELVVVWAVNSAAIQTNHVTSAGPSGNVSVVLTTLFAVGSNSVVATVFDAQQCAASCTTAVLVTLNTAPLALDDHYSVSENSTRSVPPAQGVLSNDSDSDGDSLTARLVEGPVHAASFTLNSDGSFSYTPVADYVGPDTFSYRANDGQSDSAPATVNVTVTQGPSAGCDLYPIALHEKSLENVPVGGVIGDIYNGVQPGNFGWITWAGSPSVPTLVQSLTPPGDSETYINPEASNDHVISVGDWLQGAPGVSNSSRVRAALEQLKQIDITVPVWDRAGGTGNNSLYRVAGFARVRLVSYRLPGINRITARFLGFADCHDAAGLGQ